VVPNPYQPRKVIDPEAIRELAESINAEGLLQPIVVRKVDDGFQLIAGERRLRAHQHLQRQTVLARVLQVNELSSASLSLIENLQREGLNPMEEAMGYDSLVKEFGLTQAKVAERVGKSRSYVTNSLRFLQLEGELQEFLASGSLSTGHAKILLGVEDSKLRIKLAHLTISEGWSVRQCQQAVDDHRSGQSNPSLIRKAVRGEGAFSDLARALEANLGRSVRIQAGSKGQGKLTLGFSDQNDLESILSSLGS
jgi:ParB family chromosome partitioning protein